MWVESKYSCRGDKRENGLRDVGLRFCRGVVPKTLKNRVEGLDIEIERPIEWLEITGQQFESRTMGMVGR